jgi:hypothetical protein
MNFTGLLDFKETFKSASIKLGFSQDPIYYNWCISHIKEIFDYVVLKKKRKNARIQKKVKFIPGCIRIYYIGEPIGQDIAYSLGQVAINTSNKKKVCRCNKDYFQIYKYCTPDQFKASENIRLKKELSLDKKELKYLVDELNRIKTEFY